MGEGERGEEHRVGEREGRGKRRGEGRRDEFHYPFPSLRTAAHKATAEKSVPSRKKSRVSHSSYKH